MASIFSAKYFLTVATKEDITERERERERKGGYTL
jgi:hypothetical protein